MTIAHCHTCGQAIDITGHERDEFECCGTIMSRETGNPDEGRAENGASESGASWVVVENTPGYLPEEDDPASFTDHKSACEYLRERVGEYCDFLAEGYDYAEGYEPEVFWSEDLTYARVYDPERIHDLGRVFEVLPIEEEGS